MDEAIEGLPERLRGPVVSHYLHRKTHETIAHELGVPRQTVTSRIHKGIDEIRTTLRRQGVVVGAAALGSFFEGQELLAAPDTLLERLGKLALSGGPAESAVAGSSILRRGLALGAAGGVAVVIVAALFVQAREDHAPRAPDAPVVSDVEESSDTMPMSAAIRVSKNASQTPASSSGLESWMADYTPRARPPVPGLIKNTRDRVSVVGSVVDKTGAPVADAQVTLVASGHSGLEVYRRPYASFRDPAHHYRATTGLDGVYRVEGVQFAGNARLTVWADGYAMAHGFLFLESGAGPMVMDFVLPDEAITLFARVVEPSGAPVPDAFVTVPTSQTSGGVSRSVTRFFAYTDRDGAVRISVDHRFDGSDSPGGRGAVLVVSHTHGRATFSEVEFGTDDPVELVLEPPATFAGRIEFTPGETAAPYEVVLSEVLSIGGFRDFGQTAAFSGLVDDEGRFMIENVPAGRDYRVWVLDANQTDLTARETISPLEPGERRVWNADLNERHTVTGAVYGIRSGRPLPNMRIGHGTDGWEIVDGERAWTNARGEFTLAVPESRDSLHVFAAYSFIRENDASELATLYGKSVPLSGSQTPGVTLEVPDPVALTVYTVDETEAPVPNAALWMGSAHLGYTDKEGVYRTDLYPGYVNGVHVAKYGYTHNREEGKRLEHSDEFSADLVFTLIPTAGGVEGRCIDAYGDPAPNVRVQVSVTNDKEAQWTSTTVSDHEGRFYALHWCPVGDYDELTLLAGDSMTRLENIRMTREDVLMLGDVEVAGQPHLE